MPGVPGLVCCFWLTGLTPNPSPEERRMPFAPFLGVSKARSTGTNFKSKTLDRRFPLPFGKG